MTKLRLIFAWVRRWGSLVAITTLLLLATVLWYLLRLTRQKSAARALVRRLEDAERRTEIAYERAKVEYLDEMITADKDRISKAAREISDAGRRKEEADARVDEMDDAAAVAAEFRDRLGPGRNSH